MKFSKILTFVTGITLTYGRCIVKESKNSNELSSVEDLSSNEDILNNVDDSSATEILNFENEIVTTIDPYEEPTSVIDDLLPTSTEAIEPEPTKTPLPLIPGPVSCTYKKKDTDTKFNIDSDNQINCNGTTCEVKGNGVEISEGIVTINAAGNYILQGELQGQIRIEANEKDYVHLILNDIHIKSEEGPALVALSAEKVTLTLVGDSNEFLDSDNYIETEDEKYPDACFYAKTDVSINGEGTLDITGNYNAGIHCTKDLKLVTGNVNVLDAKDKGIKVKDSICFHDANVFVNSYNSAIKVTNDKKVDKGFIVIENGNITLSTKNDALHAETHVTIYGGLIDIKDCREGIEGQMIDVLGGEIIISTTNDGFNASIIGADKKPTMPGGAKKPNFGKKKDENENENENVNVMPMPMPGGPMPEGGMPEGGMPGGPEGPGGPGGPFGPQVGPEANDGSVYINIVGGKIDITAHARGGYDIDGIDSNGILYIGGNAEVYVDLQLGKLYGDFATLDSDGDNVVSGRATVVTTSAYLSWEDAGKFMTEEEAKNRPPPPPGTREDRGKIYQPFIRILDMEKQPDHTEIILKDKNGEIIVTYTPQYAFDYILIISPKLIGGESYELTAGSFVQTVEASPADEGSYVSPSVESI
ncbi:hypothetical protein BCR32DRAFT_327689 [Anaeromyces robustus]|uniref:Carbohydrate-binding domain-containing protein n=1 Tax=Anaeromyces robustus TaxID=1754192 RepID=A0A1Y1UXL9_9FUNG|nr:hypothetical protein BCR32DRAFT_331025 [Anaeromyces robustus]ORX80477.1 hypothetical protein BCR32DRAFT_327689 [Anaeromyces robustus]|eukprot:ORX43040.1 hypothetical protein BCR32DRAFT_331025 [Anaeromyces robustus]